MNLDINSTMKKLFMSFLVVAGAFLMALAVNVIYEPADLVTGGASGLGIVLQALSKKIFGYAIPVWITCMIINVILLIVAAFKLGKEYVYKCLLGAMVFNLFLAILPVREILDDDLLAGALLGGVINGVAIGMVLYANASTGGTDLLAGILHRLLGVKTSYVIMVTDTIIVGIGAGIFGIVKTVYGIVSIYTTTKVADIIIEGPKSARMFMVISDKNDKLALYIMSKMNRGISSVSICGMYTGKERKMLICVVSKAQTVELKRKIYEIDPKSFVVVCDTTEVNGEGFVQNLQ